jgi:metallo-beta-lactamase class B
MRRIDSPAAVLLLSLAAIVSQGATLQPDPSKVCEKCGSWNRKQEPFRVFGNTYYVGVAGLSAVLIASDRGHILLDGDLPQSAPLIAENIRTLGFRLEDVRLIVNSHTHFDHAGGIAALQRASGAVVAASPLGARALEQGGPLPDDPQYGLGPELMGFPHVKAVRVVTDGETLQVGELAITAHFTPGHTPGGTTWTWRSCEETRCLAIVYADSLNAVSAPGFRYTQVPGLVDELRQSIVTIENLPCDILITVHPEFAALSGKLQRRTAGATENPFIDAQACRVYAANAARSLDGRIAEESP